MYVYMYVYTLPFCLRFLRLANCRFSATVFDNIIMIVTKKIRSLSTPDVTQIFSKQVKTLIVCLNRGSNSSVTSLLTLLNLTTKSLPAYSATWVPPWRDLGVKAAKLQCLLHLDNNITIDKIDSRCILPVAVLRASLRVALPQKCVAHTH